MTDAIRMAKCDKPVFNERVDDSKEDGTHNHFRALAVHTVLARRSSNERTSENCSACTWISHGMWRRPSEEWCRRLFRFITYSLINSIVRHCNSINLRRMIDDDANRWNLRDIVKYAFPQTQTHLMGIFAASASRHVFSADQSSMFSDVSIAFHHIIPTLKYGP